MFDGNYVSFERFARYWSKVVPHLFLMPPERVTPLEFQDDVTYEQVALLSQRGRAMLRVCQ